MPCVLAALICGTPAHADSVLIESHADKRPDDADQELAPFRDELAKLGVTVKPDDVIAKAADHLPLPGISDPTLGPTYPSFLNGRVEAGATEVFQGTLEYSTGITTLEGVKLGARSNSALVVADPALVTWMTKLYGALAYGYLRRHELYPNEGALDRANEAVDEQYRSFPDNPIGRVTGPKVEAFADARRKVLVASPIGTLIIRASKPDVQVYVNELGRGQGSVTLDGLPGKYRLLLQRLGVSRRYAMVAQAGRKTEIEIDWEADAAFSATSKYVAFEWHGREDRSEVATERYARAADAVEIIVASIVIRRNRSFLHAAVHAKKTGVLVRAGIVELGGDGHCARALARYLVKGTRSVCLLEDMDAEPAVNDTGRSWPTSSKIVLALGGVAIVGGAVALALDQDDDAKPAGQVQPQFYYDTTPAAVAAIAGGLVLCAVGGYLYLKASGSHTTAAMGPVAGGAMMTVTSKF